LSAAHTDMQLGLCT